MLNTPRMRGLLRSARMFEEARCFKWLDWLVRHCAARSSGRFGVEKWASTVSSVFRSALKAPPLNWRRCNQSLLGKVCVVISIFRSALRHHNAGGDTIDFKIGLVGFG